MTGWPSPKSQGVLREALLFHDPTFLDLLKKHPDFFLASFCTPIPHYSMCFPDFSRLFCWLKPASVWSFTQVVSWVRFGPRRSVAPPRCPAHCVLQVREDMGKFLVLCHYCIFFFKRCLSEVVFLNQHWIYKKTSSVTQSSVFYSDKGGFWIIFFYWLSASDVTGSSLGSLKGLHLDGCKPAEKNMSSFHGKNGVISNYI